MNEEQQQFEYAKGKLLVLFLALATLFLLALYFLKQVVQGMLILDSWFVIFLVASTLFLTYPLILACFKLLSPHPYMVMTDEWIVLEPKTRREKRVHVDQIDSIQIRKWAFQIYIEIDVTDVQPASGFVSGLSRMTGFAYLIIQPRIVVKNQRNQLYTGIDYLIRKRYAQAAGKDIPDIVDLEGKVLRSELSEKDFLAIYAPIPPDDRKVDATYVRQAYGYGLFIFAISFALLYVTSGVHPTYILCMTINLILFPLVKAGADLAFRFKLTRKLSYARGIQFYAQQVIMLLDVLLFHASIPLFPLALLFLLIGKKKQTPSSKA